MAETGEDVKKGQPFSKSEGINASDSGFTGSLNVYCVDCSATGSMVVSGQTSFFGIATGLLGLNDGYVHVDVSSVLALKLGVEAELAYDTGYLWTPLFTKSLSWITIAGAFEVGPSITIEAGFHLNAVASGSVLAGGQFTLDGASWRADLKTGNTTRSDNWMPRFDPIFKADGDISVSAEVSLPISIDVSIKALGGLFEASAGIGDHPSLRATAQISAELSLNKDMSITSSLTSDNNCTGISYKLGWENLVEGHVRTNMMDGWVAEALTFGVMEGDLLQDCFQLGSNSTDAVNSKRQSDNNVPSDHDDSDIILYSNPKIPSASYDTTDGFGFAGLRTYDDSDNMNSLYNCADDNFYVSTSDDSNFCSSLYRFRNDTVLLSADNSLMHYYGNTMARLGVSRLRTAPPEWIPRSSIYVSLIPAARLQYSEQLGYVARDMVGHIFFPVICEYKNDTLQSKVFVVEDLDEGIETLKSPSVVYSVTNGEVEDCWPLPLILGDD